MRYIHCELERTVTLADNVGYGDLGVYGGGIHNLFHVYRPLLDVWTLFDNSTAKPFLVAKQEGGMLKIFDQVLFDKIVKGAN